jgi:F420-0:gamma-glutamyl ligase-like protein
MAKKLKPNKNKKLVITVGNKQYIRLPIKTSLVTKRNNIVRLCEKQAKDYLKPGDILFVSEKIVAISQGRAYRIKDINPSRMAMLLQTYVTKSPYGIGLGSPWTMQLAIDEIGLPRILFASTIAAVTKAFGVKGAFYIVAGKKAKAIDGPCNFTIAPYNKYASLSPANPSKVAKEIKQALGYDVVIVDANDLGVDILGRSSRRVDTKLCKEAFRDNPIGQGHEQTPLCILRPVAS